jgi:DNA-binding SARP family transcriptional activator
MKSIVNQNPWLLYWRGTSGTGLRHAQTQSDLQEAYAVFHEQQDIVGTLLCAAAMIIALEGDANPIEMDPWISKLEDVISQTEPHLPREIETYVTAGLLAALAARIPHHPNGQQWAERALELARLDDNLAFRALTAVNWVQYHYQIGQVSKAVAVLDEMRVLSNSLDVSPVVAINASMSVCACEFLLGLPSYRQTVSKALELAQSKGTFYAARFSTLAHGLFSALSEGDIDLTNQWLHEFEKEARFVGKGFYCFHRICSVWKAMIENNIDGAAVLQSEMLELGIRNGWPLEEALTYLWSALFFHCRKETAPIFHHLESTHRIARTMKSPYVEFMARKIEAHICFDNGEDTKALDSLRIAMELGRKGGFVNSQVWMPKMMARLCAKALEHGIEVDYAKMLIKKRNLVPDEPPLDIEAWPWPVKIYTLGKFRVIKDDQPLAFSHKVQRKPLALLKAIIALGGKTVSEDKLLDALWPDADGDAARFALTSAVHRLRKLLGHEQAIVRQDNEISLDERYCWTDVWAVERLLTRAEQSSRANGFEPINEQSIQLIQKAVALYKGLFLGNDPDAQIGQTTNDRLRRRLLRQLTALAQYWERKADLAQAVNSYEEALRIDPCAEDICRRLMTAYHKLGRPAESLSVYNALKEALNDRLGIEPSAETAAMVKQLEPR